MPLKGYEKSRLPFMRHSSHSNNLDAFKRTASAGNLANGADDRLVDVCSRIASAA
jgi:hypothetical protein